MQQRNKTAATQRAAWIMAAASLFLISARVNAQTSVALSPVPAQQFLSNAGVPLAQGCVYTFISGTSTPLATYTDGTGTAQNTNPVILDAGGFGNIWLSNSSYRFTVYSYGSGAVGANCGNGVSQRTVDNVSAYAIINQAQNLFLTGAGSDPIGSAGELAYRTDIPCFRGFTTFWDCFVRLTDTQTLTNKTLASPTITGTATGTGATIVSVGLTNPLVGGVLMQSPATYTIYNNDTSTGTVASKLVKLTGAATAILPTTSDTGGVVGIAVSGAGNGSGTVVTVEQSGGGTGCIFDGTTTANDYVQISPTIAGDCHDAGPTYPSSGQVIGRVQVTWGGGAGQNIGLLLFPPEIRGSGYKLENVNVVPVTVANTVSQTNLKTFVIPGGDIGQNQTMYFDGQGIVGATGTPTLTVAAMLDGVTVCTMTITLAAANTQPWALHGFFTGLTTGVAGTVSGCHMNWTSTASGGGNAIDETGVGAPPQSVTVDTTISHVLAIQVQWSAANALNTVTQNTFTVYRIG